MTQDDAHHRPNVEAEINPLAAWLVPSGLLISGLLGLAMWVATLEASWSGNIAETVAPELPVQGIPLSISWSHALPVEVAASVLPIGQRSLAFGYLEFDWNAQSGVPGFDRWPN
jgi:hypothetical protein